jgi:hypothetical protein
MGGYTSVNDSAFDRPIALRDAYRIMERFVTDYLSRGDVPVSDFLTYLSLMPTGESCDPAAIYDFLDAANSTVGSVTER